MDGNHELSKPKQVSRIELLKFIAKYRFVTANNVQINFNYKSRTSVNNKLKRLVGVGLVGMRYDKTKRLLGAPAVFYVTPKGLRILQTHLPYITEATIRNAYGDQNVADSFVQKSGELFEYARSLHQSYPQMTVLTARQLGDFDYFPNPLPDLYLARKSGNETRRFFLFSLRDVKRYDIAVRSCIRKIVAYRESDTYAQSGNEFPVLLFVCHSKAIERLVQRTMRSALSTSYESISAYTASHQALINHEDASGPLWADIEDPEVLLDFEDM